MGSEASIKKPFPSSIIFSILILTACLSPSGGVSTPTATSTPSETPSPTPTETPTPQSLLPQEVKEKFELAGVDLTQMQNAKYDKDGLHITLESGEVIVLTNDQLQKGMYNGQDNVLQYRDEANQNVIYAFDPENKTFLEASKYIQKDKTDPEKYIQVANWDELFALWAKEKMFLIPFDPENTYFPPLDKIYVDYSHLDFSKAYESRDIDPEFNYFTPFGIFLEGMDSPFKFVNFIRMQKDASDGRPYDSFIVSEQVFNVDDGSFATLHFMIDDQSIAFQVLTERISDSTFFLPRFLLTRAIINDPTSTGLKDFLNDKGLLNDDGSIPQLKSLVLEWFDSGHVSQELESIPTTFIEKSIR